MKFILLGLMFLVNTRTASQDDSAKRIGKLIQRLSSDSVEEREKAAHEISEMDLAILPILRREMAQANDKETRSRIADLIESMASIALFAPSLSAKATDTLKDFLIASDKDAHIIAYPSLAKTLTSKANILVLLLLREDGVVGDKDLDALKKRKVIGIGYGAAELFGRMGLEISGGACAHKTGLTAPRITPEKSAFFSGADPKISFVAFRLPRPPKDFDDFHFSMHVPRKSELLKFVDVLARDESWPNYAPIVRQGNDILCGLSASPETWTPEFSRFFHDLVIALKSRKLEAFARAKWEVTKPGTYEFALAEGGSTEELSDRAFYFQFTKPTTLSVLLKHKASNNMMLMGYGKRGDRKDAERGEPLEISIEISADDIKEMGDGYWKVDVTNFDRAHKAECRMTVQYRE